MKQIKIMLCLFIIVLAGCSTAPSNEKKENYKLSAFSMPVQSEYKYDYLGMSFQLGEEMNKALEEGKLFMYLDAGYTHDKELAYARQCILYVPKEDREKIWENDTQKVQEWKEQAQIFGYIGVYKRDIIEETDIAELTNCTQNKNIGETSDGIWQYYISSNDVAEVQQIVERFRRILVTIYDMEPFAEGVSIFAEARDYKKNIEDFQATDIYGNVVTKDVFADYDLTLVNVFTPWASSCVQEITELEKVKQYNFGERSVNVVGIVYDTAQNEEVDVMDVLKTIQNELSVTYTFVLPDAALMEGRLKGIAAFPETFFVDRQGNIIGEYYLGARPSEDWIEIINQLLLTY